MSSALGSARVEARIRHSSGTADTTPGEAGGDVSADAPGMPDVDDPADDAVMQDVDDPADDAVMPDVDAPAGPGR